MSDDIDDADYVVLGSSGKSQVLVFIDVPLTWTPHPHMATALPKQQWFPPAGQCAPIKPQNVLGNSSTERNKKAQSFEHKLNKCQFHQVKKNKK